LGGVHKIRPHQVLGIVGGAGGKRKKGEMANPFDDEAVEYATAADAPMFQEAFICDVCCR
jgi:hypothetical protein